MTTINGYTIKPGANLHGADLHGADLHGADLRSADLYGANLRGADLYGANLRGADLRGADLHSANLHSANLHGADLYGANLRGADLRGADLHGADLRSADLHGADLHGTKNVPQHVVDMTCITPEGVLRVYKKTTTGIAVLEIPAKAKRSNATGRKCRADYAKVISAPENARSVHDSTFRYVRGKTVRPTKPFDTDRWNECASGIHFYLTRGEAESN